MNGLPITHHQVGQAGLIHLLNPSLIRKSSQQIRWWLHLFTKIGPRLLMFSRLFLIQLVGQLTINSLRMLAWPIPGIPTIILTNSSRINRRFPTGLTGNIHPRSIRHLPQFRLHLPSRNCQIIPPLTVIIQLELLNMCNLNNANFVFVLLILTYACKHHVNDLNNWRMTTINNFSY